MKKKFFTKKIIAFLSSLGIAFSVLPTPVFTETVYAAVSETTSLKNIKTEDGIMIQMHMWSFNNIRSKLPEIATSGFKAIQVSPIQGCIQGNQWWALYQPTNQAIGNPLGSRDDFKALCSEAEAYGIDIIVDVVMNHMANNGAGKEDTWSSQVVDEFKNWNYYHHQGQNSDADYKDRMRTTQGGIGMPDLNTQNADVQQKAINFLNDCISAGADGFRFDAAKHIETNIGVDSGKWWAGNYWTNVLGSLNNKDKLFIYGEVLDEANSDADNMSAYATFMSVTDHYYGQTLRNAVTSYNFPAAQNWNISVSGDRRVSYVENHDDYEHNKSTSMSEQDRIFAWAYLAARDNVTPMYLSRRTGSVGSIGTSDWNNSQVKAINWFHNAVAGQTEYLRYPNGNTCAQIDRGTIGTAFINLGSGFNLNQAATNLKNGTYTDKGGSGQTYTVSNSKISGYVPGRSIIVIYDGEIVVTPANALSYSPETPAAGENVTITYDASGTVLKGSAVVNVKWGYDNWKEAVTQSMTSIGSNKWTITLTVPSAATAKLDLAFTNGNGTWDNNNSSDYKIPVKEKTVETTNTAYFDNSSSNWNTVYAYLYDESGSTIKEVAPWPGVAMTKQSGSLYSYTLTSDWKDARVIFNNGSSLQIPAAKKEGFSLTQNMIYKNGSWEVYSGSETPATSYTAYFDNTTYNWNTAYVYIYDEKSTSTVQEVAPWPGVPMTNNGNNLYSYKVTENWNNLRVIFNNGSNAQIPLSDQEGFTLTSDMIYKNGSWLSYTGSENPVQETVAYFDNASYNWSQVFIYIYDEKSSSSVQEVAPWPGVAMTNESGNLFSYEITKDWDNLRVIFNNGSNMQLPASDAEGYPISNQSMILSNGNWTAK